VNCFGWIGLIVATCTACTHLDDLTNVPPYSEHIKGSYILNRDCYVVQFHWSRKLNPYIKSGILDSMFPEPTDARLVGKDVSDGRILGILRKGTVLRIFELKRERTFESSHYWCLVAPEGSAQQLWPALDASLVKVNPSEFPPVINPKIAAWIKPQRMLRNREWPEQR
jgi:hypothetical protein